tara:strand:+ start:2319 stop:2999 length:681 start_codon:yes stop_codon:yes gene_type:complete
VNYAELLETIKGYCENDFPDTSFTNDAGELVSLTSTEQVNRFIKQSEQKIYNSVQILALKKNVVGSLTLNNQYMRVPTDWLADFSLAVIHPTTGAYNYLLSKDVNYIREAFPNPTSTGTPTHYALFSDVSFIVGPTPDQNYEAELHYFYYPETIITAGNSWLGDNYDSALLYGCLIEAHIFMKGEADTYQYYTQRYNESIVGLKQLSEGKNRQDAYRTEQARYQVK